MKPFMKYPGGKSKEAELVRRYLPQQLNRYFEPFVGGGSIYFDLMLANSFINDFSTDLIVLYQMIQNQNPQLHHLLSELNELWILVEDDFDDAQLQRFNYLPIQKYHDYHNDSLNRKNRTISKFEEKGKPITQEDIRKMHLTAKKTAVYMMIRDVYNNRAIGGALHIACYYFLREYCYSSMFRFASNGDFNVPYGGLSYNEKYLTSKINYMYSQEMQLLMNTTTVCNLDFEDFLNQYHLEVNDFIFLDPPYDSEFSTYDNNVFDRNEQIRLKEFLQNTNARWMLIIKATDFIRELYADFNIYEYDKNYYVSFMNRNEKDVKHLLITNYPING